MRKDNWPRIISEEIKNHKNVPFVWGEKDCCLAVADIMLAYTGVDFAAEFRGKYTTAKGSLMALKKYGKGSLKATLDAKFPSIEITEAGRGDVGLVETGGGESMAIIFSNIAWAMNDEGIVDLPMSSLICAWRIE